MTIPTPESTPDPESDPDPEHEGAEQPDQDSFYEASILTLFTLKRVNTLLARNDTLEALDYAVNVQKKLNSMPGTGEGKSMFTRLHEQITRRGGG